MEEDVEWRVSSVERTEVVICPIHRWRYAEARKYNAGGTQYVWPVNGTGQQTFALRLADASNITTSSHLTDICEQNIVGEDPAGQVVFRQPPYAPGEAGSCV